MSTSPATKKPRLDAHTNGTTHAAPLDAMLNPAPPQQDTSDIHNLPSTSTMAPMTNSTAPATATPPLLVKKLSDKARAPTRGSAFAAGYDIYSAHSTTVPARGKALVDTDIAIAVPAGTYGRIAPRSGLASKHSIDVGAGVIDADYRGQVKVLLFNLSDTDFEVQQGERVAQLILERIWTPEVVVVEELEESVRGLGGFGSTGGFGNGGVVGSGGVVGV